MLLDEIRKPITVYRCPSDGGPDHIQHEFKILLQNDGTPAESVPTNNYVGSNGSGTRDRTVSQQTGERFNGIFSDSNTQPVGFRDISDGASNTILVGERSTWLPNPAGGEPLLCGALNYLGYRSGGPPIGPRHGTTVSNGRWGLNMPTIDCFRGFNSRHPGGALFALCDGSVRFISELIEMNTADVKHNDTVFENLLNRRDGDVVGEF